MGARPTSRGGSEAAHRGGQDRRDHSDHLERRGDDLPPDKVLRPSRHRGSHAAERLVAKYLADLLQ